LPIVAISVAIFLASFARFARCAGCAFILLSLPEPLGSCCWCDYIKAKIPHISNSKMRDSFWNSGFTPRTRGFCTKRNLLESAQNGRFGSRLALSWSALGSCSHGSLMALSWFSLSCAALALSCRSRGRLVARGALSCSRLSCGALVARVVALCSRGALCSLSARVLSLMARSFSWSARGRLVVALALSLSALSWSARVALSAHAKHLPNS
jgi:hypothetical protein